MTDRRTFLKKFGLTCLGTAASVLALPAPATTTPVDHVSAGGELSNPVLEGIENDAEITEEDDSPLALWQYKRDGSGYVPTSPINVAIPIGETGLDLDDVLGVLEDAGWERSPEEYVRYAWDRQSATFVRQHATAAETYFGTSGRHHVRCWSFEGWVSMQAHVDSRALPKHRVVSYERARAMVERHYAAAGWRIDRNAVEFENEKGDHDGTATLLRRGDRS